MITEYHLRVIRKIVRKYSGAIEIFNLLGDDMESQATYRLLQYYNKHKTLPGRNLFFVIVRRAISDARRAYYGRVGTIRDIAIKKQVASDATPSYAIPWEMFAQQEEDNSYIEESVDNELSKLNSRQRLAFVHYYGYCEQMDLIAAKLGVSQTRVSQLLDQCFDKLGLPKREHKRSQNVNHTRS